MHLVNENPEIETPTNPESPAAPPEPENPEQPPAPPPPEDPDRTELEEQLTQESYQRKLNEYKAAFESEFRIADAGLPPANKEGSYRDYFKQHVPLAAARIVDLINNSTSDSVQFSACKFLLAEAFLGEGGETDPTVELLRQLTSGKTSNAKHQAATVPVPINFPDN